MDFNTTVDLIIKDLEEARNIIDDLLNYPGVPVLQVEMAKSKCKSVAEIIALLKDMRNEVSPDKEEEVHNSKKDSGEPSKTGIENEHTQKEPDTINIPFETDIEDMAPPESSTIGDSYGITERINEQMGSMRGRDSVTEMMSARPLANLDDAIGVNDKFLFIREIFNGSPESYVNALGRLNSVKTFAEARAVVMDYTEDKKESVVIKQFLDIVKRKFRSDE